MFIKSKRHVTVCHVGPIYFRSRTFVRPHVSRATNIGTRRPWRSGNAAVRVEWHHQRLFQSFRWFPIQIDPPGSSSWGVPVATPDGAPAASSWPCGGSSLGDCCSCEESTSSSWSTWKPLPAWNWATRFPFPSPCQTCRQDNWMRRIAIQLIICLYWPEARAKPFRWWKHSPFPDRCSKSLYANIPVGYNVEKSRGNSIQHVISV